MHYKRHFPDIWNDDELDRIILDLVTDPELPWKQITGQRGFLVGRPKFMVDGFRNHTWIRVIIEPGGRGVLAAFPLNAVDGERYTHPPNSACLNP